MTARPSAVNAKPGSVNARPVAVNARPEAVNARPQVGAARPLATKGSIPHLLLLSVCLFITAAEGSEAEFRLIQDLRQNYDTIERPVANHTEPVVVKFRLLLQQIVDVDEKNQVLTLVMWTQTRWHDYKMRWDPAEYSGIKTIQLPNSFLWKPDILLFNSADENFDASFSVNFVVQYTGDILLAPPGIIKLSCPIDITWFPYDDQVCQLKYGSWTYNGNQLDLVIDNEGLTPDNQMDLQYYINNGEWELLATPAERLATEFYGQKYVELYFRVHMKRKTLYYGLNWIVPSVLISLSNVLGFTLPPECGEKITLQITNLLSVTVFLGMVSEITPPTSESIPVIAVFFSISMLLLGCSIVVTILIINIYYRSLKTHEMSSYMRQVFLEWLPWVLLMSRPGKRFTRPTPRRQGSNTSTDSSELSSSSGVAYCFSSDKSFNRLAITVDAGVDRTAVTRRMLSGEMVDKLVRHDSQVSLTSGHRQQRLRLAAIQNAEKDPALAATLRLEKSIQDCVEMLAAFKEKIEIEEQEADAQADWRFVAMVMDRISLYIFTGLFIATILFLLISTPRIFDHRPITKTVLEEELLIDDIQSNIIT